MGNGVSCRCRPSLGLRGVLLFRSAGAGRKGAILMAGSGTASVVAVIPARYASTRLPGKPLVNILGQSMIRRVFERVRRAQSLSNTVVATDDARIQAAVDGFGGQAAMTRADHLNGTERVAEVAVHIEAEIYVNVQGDEPLIDPAAIDAVVGAMLEDNSVQIATPCVLIRQTNEIMDPNIVKVARDFDGNGLYFSRAPIPWVRDSAGPVAATHWKHIGLYGYRREALLEYPTLPPGESNAWNNSSSFGGWRMATAYGRLRPITMPSAWMCPRISSGSRN